MTVELRQCRRVRIAGVCDECAHGVHHVVRSTTPARVDVSLIVPLDRARSRFRRRVRPVAVRPPGRLPGLGHHQATPRPAKGAGGYRRSNSRIRRTTSCQASGRCVTSSRAGTLRCASFRASRRSASSSTPRESGANQAADKSVSPVPGSGPGCAVDGYHRPSGASQEPGVKGEATDMTDLSVRFRRGVVPMRGGNHDRSSCQVRVPSGLADNTTNPGDGVVPSETPADRAAGNAAAPAQIVLADHSVTVVRACWV
jgi:hypothetical protein